MKKLTGGQAAISALQTENVRHLFGLIGSAGMEIFDALYDASDIRFIGVRDERTGVHMADGYARASGRAGVFFGGAKWARRNQFGHRLGASGGGIFAGGVHCRRPVIRACLS